MVYDLQIGWSQVRWSRHPKRKWDVAYHDDFEHSIRTMFAGLDIEAIDVDRSYDVNNPPPITIRFKNEHELTAAKLLI